MAKTHPDQMVLEGTEPNPRNERVRRAARRYTKERDARIKANKEETAAHDSLMDALREEGFEQGYDDGSIQVAIDTSRKAKVSTPEKGKAEDSGEE